MKHRPGRPPAFRTIVEVAVQRPGLSYIETMDSRPGTGASARYEGADWSAFDGAHVLEVEAKHVEVAFRCGCSPVVWVVLAEDLRRAIESKGREIVLDRDVPIIRREVFGREVFGQPFAVA